MRLLRWSFPLLVASVAAPAPGQTWSKDFVTVDIGTGWDRPTCLCFPSPNSNVDLLVAEKTGRVSNVHNGIKQLKPVVDLRDEVLDNGDRGLLSVLADPEWESNGWIYLLYIVDPNADGSEAEQESFGRLTRYTTYFDKNGDLLADPASRVVLIGATWPEGIPSLHLSHATGNMRFGTDGSLFVSTGDGAHYDLTDAGGHDRNGFGSGKFPPSEDIGAFRSLSPTSLAGKILRVDPSTGLGLPDNPLYTGNAADNQSRVWALGLRNPFRFTLQPDSGTPGRLFIADVGWGLYEEIDEVTAGGENFGWPCWEGPFVQTSYDAADPSGWCDDPTIFTKPLWSYHHFNPGSNGFVGQSITGMHVYTGTEYPSKYVGRLFFCDYSSNWIRTVRFVNGLPTDVEVFGSTVGNPVELIGDPVNGDLLYIAIGKNAVRRIRYTKANHPPEVVASATPRWGSSPLTVTFDASGSTDPEGQPLTFLWNFGDGQTDTQPTVAHTYNLDQNYAVSLTVTDVGGEKSTWDTLISVGNTPPVIRSIHSPQDGSYFTDGQLLVFDATADDAEDGAAGIPLTAEWRIDLVHDHHEHPAWQRLPGLYNQWTADAHGEGTYYHVTLRVTDSRGLFAEESLDLYDLESTPAPHLVSVSNTAPRLGTEITATGHVHYAGKGNARLVFRWGDGTADRFDVAHLEDRQPVHKYTGPGLYTLRLATSDGATKDSVTQTILVRPRHPAVAIFVPLVAVHWIKADEQWRIASQVADAVRAAGFEARIFGPFDQDALAGWMDTYLDDGLRDYLVCLDCGPSVSYAGQNDGSRAEAWLDKGNGLLWTGYNPFARYILPDGTDSNAGSFKWAADEILDAAVPQLCSGFASMQLEPDAAALPALQPFTARRALVSDRLNPNWSIEKLYASDGGSPVMSDAFVIRSVDGGEYAQFHCVFDLGMPRAEVLRDFFLTHLFSDLPSGPGTFKLVQPANHASRVPTTNIDFKWRSQNGATSWMFEIAHDREFAQTIRVEVVDQPSYRLTANLREPDVYFWRVTARNDYGWWTSDPFDFSCGTPASR